MPELPEVETIARGLRERLLGARIERVSLGPHDYVAAPPPSIEAHLVGRTVAGVRRHGKRLSLDLAPDGEVLLHLGMSGQITLQPAGDAIAPHTHLRLGLGDREDELRVRDARRFGGVWIVNGHTEARPAPLGPDALAIRLPGFRRLLSRSRQVKALLLDQHAIAGIGNIYADEALWAARIHPLAPASALDDERVRALLAEIRRVLRRAIRHGGSTLRDYRDATGGEGAFQSRHRVYGREGEPCPRCGRPIRRVLVASRSSHVCPRCQRPPRRVPAS